MLLATSGSGGDGDEFNRDLPQVLERVQQALSASIDSSKTLYVLQAEVLITAYMFHTNKRTAGHYHAAAAMSIAVGSKLHKIRSAEWADVGAAVVPDPEVQLLPPVDDVEEGERVRAFWTIFSLDRCLSVTFHSPSLLTQHGTAATRVDAPWPLEMSEYEQVSSLIWVSACLGSVYMHPPLGGSIPFCILLPPSQPVVLLTLFHGPK